MVIVIFVLLVIVPQHVTPLYVTDEVWLLQIVLEELPNANDRKNIFAFQNKCFEAGGVSRYGVKPSRWVGASLVSTTPAGSLDDCNTMGDEALSPIGWGDLPYPSILDFIWIRWPLLPSGTGRYQVIKLWRTISP